MVAASARVGPNTALGSEDIETVIRELKARLVGRGEVCGPALAQSLAQPAPVDKYGLYFHPVALGQGTPFFASPHPQMRLVPGERIGGEVIKLTYVAG